MVTPIRRRNGIPMNGKSLFLTLTCVAFLATACGEDEITAYSTPKGPPASVQGLVDAARTDAPTAQNGKPGMLWTLPSGWRRQAGEQPMRMATVEVGEGPDLLEVAVSQLPSPVGTLMGNVNRWRRQVGLEALSSDEFSRMVKNRESGFLLEIGIKKDPRLEGILFDIKGTMANGEVSPKRMLIAHMKDSFQRTWFVKALNTPVRIEQHIAELRAFIASFRLEGSAPPPPPEQSGAPLTWSTPAGWAEEAPSSGMITAAFTVGDAAAQAQITIMALGGDGGGALPNLNRWRRQVGLPPLDNPNQQKQHAVTIDGKQMAIFDITSADGSPSGQQRIFVGGLMHEGRTWYFKMRGPNAVVSANEQGFNELLKSIRFSRKGN